MNHMCVCVCVAPKEFVIFFLDCIGDVSTAFYVFPTTIEKTVLFLKTSKPFYEENRCKVKIESILL